MYLQAPPEHRRVGVVRYARGGVHGGPPLQLLEVLKLGGAKDRGRTLVRHVALDCWVILGALDRDIAPVVPAALGSERQDEEELLEQGARK